MNIIKAKTSFFSRILFLSIFTLVGCSTSISIDSSYLQENGDYIDINHAWNEHELTVQKISALNVFGMTQIEWESRYGTMAVYKIYSWANALTSRGEVEQRAYDAMKVVAKNRGAKYYALIGGNTSFTTTEHTTTTYDTSTVNTSVRGKPIYSTTIRTPTHETTNYTFYSFNSYALCFDKDEDIPIVRNDFDVIHIYETGL
ncbi:MAG: hypothetical protein IJS09_03000 [Treponema sp.]|nr:hypothetical protein [Treponema sp.]